MRLPSPPDVHLTYCQNIHPGESWTQHHEAIQNKATAVRDSLNCTAPFGLGLRISAQAADELASPEALLSGETLFSTEKLYPFSINGFPFGRFHRGPVKENVYAPDWRTPERLHYTVQLARILARWLPPGLEGSISTVPGSFAQWIQSESDQQSLAENLGRIVVELVHLERHTGRCIHVGLEPEPDCFLETTLQTVRFFEGPLAAHAVPLIQNKIQVSQQAAEALLRRHLGVCFDTCHAALQYENLTESLQTYQKAGILISKIQLSAALKAPAHPDSYRALQRFAEPTYLHQVKARTSSGERVAWTDLPVALNELPVTRDLEELRVHFHVPLFLSPQTPLESTADALDSHFWALLRGGICCHLEIETYTFDVLPLEVRPNNLIESIVSEYRWVLDQLCD